MNTLPPEPSAKDPISATFIKALMRYIRANTILNGPGYRTNRGPNGTTLKIDSVKGKASPVPSYWTFSYPKDVEGEEDEQENDHGKEPEEACWHNCRLQIGYDASFSELECTDGLKAYDDGVYYAEVNLIEHTCCEEAAHATTFKDESGHL